MIHKYTDDQLREMGVAEYHIIQWNRNERIQKAIDRSILQWAIMGVETDREELEKIRLTILENYDELV